MTRAGSQTPSAFLGQAPQKASSERPSAPSFQRTFQQMDVFLWEFQPLLGTLHFVTQEGDSYASFSFQVKQLQLQKRLEEAEKQLGETQQQLQLREIEAKSSGKGGRQPPASPKA